MHKGLLAAAGLGSIVIALSGCGILGGSSANQANAGSAYGGNNAAKSTPTAAAPMQTGTVLNIKKTSLGYVLTNSKGLTLYWLSKDVRGTKSVCVGNCATAWPPVTGKPVAASGVKLNGVLGSITRAGGVVQATYNGYPLYTYAEDTSPGQTSGNGEAGVWHVITGKVLTSLSSSGSTGSRY
jgi:predicted lipoprotein with Yx(FWY)xxD motif